MPGTQFRDCNQRQNLKAKKQVQQCNQLPGAPEHVWRSVWSVKSIRIPLHSISAISAISAKLGSVLAPTSVSVAIEFAFPAPSLTGGGVVAILMALKLQSLRSTFLLTANIKRIDGKGSSQPRAPRACSVINGTSPPPPSFSFFVFLFIFIWPPLPHPTHYSLQAFAAVFCLIFRCWCCLFSCCNVFFICFRLPPCCCLLHGPNVIILENNLFFSHYFRIFFALFLVLKQVNCRLIRARFFHQKLDNPLIFDTKSWINSRKYL